jgi:hypothetical protein
MKNKLVCAGCGRPVVLRYGEGGVWYHEGGGWNCSDGQDGVVHPKLDGVLFVEGTYKPVDKYGRFQY